ncbi:MAG: hypothetical protein ACPHHS_03605 [Candidatus Poseidoniaceae archaeon]
MAEEVSPEKAKEIVEMLTGGGSIDSINTSLALGILPLVESLGDTELLDRLVAHAEMVAEDDIEKGWARFEHLKRYAGSIDDVAELAFHAESLDKGTPLAAAVLHHHALMLLSIEEIDSAQTSIRRSLTLRESIEDKEGIIYGLAVLSRCARLNQDWDSAILHDTRRLELAISMQNDVLHMARPLNCIRRVLILPNVLSIRQVILSQVGALPILQRLRQDTMMPFLHCPIQCIFSSRWESLLQTC